LNLLAGHPEEIRVHPLRDLRLLFRGLDDAPDMRGVGQKPLIERSPHTTR
jgi:hypothetical protein